MTQINYFVIQVMPLVMVKAIYFKVKKTPETSPVDMDHGDFFSLQFVRPTQHFVPL